MRTLAEIKKALVFNVKKRERRKYLSILHPYVNAPTTASVILDTICAIKGHTIGPKNHNWSLVDGDAHNCSLCFEMLIVKRPIK